MHRLWILAIFLLCITAKTSCFADENLKNVQIQSDTIKVNGVARHYLYYIPSKLPINAPLVFVLHGSMSNANHMRTITAYQFEKLADHYHFVVVYPEGFEGHWNDCRKKATYSAKKLNIDDVTFIRQIAQQLHQRYQVNLMKVYAMGYSNGGHMAYRLALEAPDLISAIAVVSANLPTAENFDCKIENKSVSVLIINGTRDPINPYDGGNVSIFGFGNRGRVKSAYDSAEWFAQHSKATLIQEKIRLPALNSSTFFSAEQTVWKNMKGIKITLITIHGGGHTLPQPYVTYPIMLGLTYTGIDGPLEIWKFFSE